MLYTYIDGRYLKISHIPNVLFRLKNLRPLGMVTYWSASQTSLLALSIFSFVKVSNSPIKVLNLNKCMVNLECIKGIRVEF